MEQEIIRIDLTGVNAYLIKENDNFILIDTGGHMTMDKPFDSRCNLLEKELIHSGCTPENLKLILLTHGDNDHVANANYIRKKYSSKIAMHSSDVELVEHPTTELVMNNFKFNTLPFKLISKVMQKPIIKIMQKVLDEYEPFHPDLFIDKDMDLLPFGIHAKILNLPGHTLGSIGILTSNGSLISGDTFANTKKPEPAPNAADFKLLYETINVLSSMNIKAVYPGHGNPFQMKEYIKYN